jgi:GDP-L-fucose synthase
MSEVMHKDARIYIAGHRGLVGSALLRGLQQQGYTNLLTRNHAELDLCEQAPVEEYFQTRKPEYVFLAAAKVGGILANSEYPAEFIRQNLVIQTNVIHAAWRSGVKRLLFLGSSCIYPRDCPQPIREDYLLSGPLEPTNRPYALAKIAGIEMCWSYNRQYASQYLAVMPTNLYGPGDNYDLQKSHVIPALIRKMHEAKQAGAERVVIWGTGTPRREFLYSEDMAQACIYLMNLSTEALATVFNANTPPLINIGCGEDLTIHALAQQVAATVGFRGQLHFDSSKPDGTPRKLLDVSRLYGLGWRPRVDLTTGLQRAYQDFLDNHAIHISN